MRRVDFIPILNTLLRCISWHHATSTGLQIILAKSLIKVKKAKSFITGVLWKNFFLNLIIGVTNIQ
jgi:hypothetical protein